MWRSSGHKSGGSTGTTKEQQSAKCSSGGFLIAVKISVASVVDTEGGKVVSMLCGLCLAFCRFDSSK